jgi:hypothetical protein
MKWWWISMCLEWDKIAGEADRVQATWLSESIEKGCGAENFKEPRETYNQRASLNAWVVAWYFASVEDNAMDFCLTDDQDIKEPWK